MNVRLMTLLAGWIVLSSQSVMAQPHPGRFVKVELPKCDGILNFAFRDSLLGCELDWYDQLVVTTDGGKTWSYRERGIGIPSQDHFSPLVAISPTSAFYTENTVTVWFLPDTIEYIQVPIGGNYATICQTMSDSSHGYRFEQEYDLHGGYEDTARLIATDDGWHSYRIVSQPYVNPSLRTRRQLDQILAATIVDTTDIWASVNSAIIHTTDGGNSWKTSYPLDTTRFPTGWERIIVFPKTREVWLKTETGPFDYVYSSDYGQSWLPDSTFHGYSCFVDVPKSGTIWAVVASHSPHFNLGDRPPLNHFNLGDPPYLPITMLAYSSNNGETWSRDSETFRYDTITEMHWIDERHGWIATKNKSIWHYEPDFSAVPAQKEQANALEIYPNPASAILHVTNAYGKLHITDLLGREYPCEQTVDGIRIGSLKPGIYNLRDAIARGRFVKY